MDLQDINWESFREGFELTLLFIINYLIVFSLIFKILLENRNPQKTYAYIVVLLAVPILGIFIYFSFGQNYRRNKMFSRKKILDDQSFQKMASRLLLKIQKHELSAEHPQKKITELLTKGSHSLLTHGNDLQLLINGEECFPKMLEEIEKAEKHIHIEYYIITDDTLGMQFIQALCKKAIEGVNVRLIYDAVGSIKLSKKGIATLKEAGVHLLPFLPIRLPKFANSLNYRNHRKILVIDGKVGFVGGINIDQRYDNRFDNKMFWRDSHLMIQGNGVWGLQLTFLFDWFFCTKDIIDFSEDYFPFNTKKSESSPLQIVSSGPDSDWANIMHAYFSAINSAKREIRLTTPYFIPNESLLTSLKTAALGGIDVQLLLPAESDSKLVQMAMRSYFKELLKAGVNIYQYKKGFVHAKTMTVDDNLCTIGTANMDFRSFELNFEVNAFVYDKDITSQLVDVFEQDKKEATLVKMEEILSWNLRRRLGNSMARLFAPLL